MGILAWIVLGLIAGFIGSKIVNHTGSGVIMDIVLGGKLKAQGMVGFSDRLNTQQAQSIHAYLIQRAQEDWQPDFTKPTRK